MRLTAFSIFGLVPLHSGLITNLLSLEEGKGRERGVLVARREGRKISEQPKIKLENSLRSEGSPRSGSVQPEYS